MNVIRLYKNNNTFEAINKDAIFLSEKFGLRLFQNKNTMSVSIAKENVDLIEFVLKQMNIKIEFYDSSYQENANVVVCNNSDDNVLQLFINNIDYYTGEVITGVSNELKNYINNLGDTLSYYVGNFCSKDKWTDEDINILKERYPLGVSFKNLARAMSVKHTHKEIRNKAIELKLLRRKSAEEENIGARWTEEEEQNLSKEFISGLSIKEIANIHKRRYGGIRARLRKLGLIDKNGNKTF